MAQTKREGKEIMLKVVLTGGSKGLGRCIKERLEHEYEPGFGGHSEQKYAVIDFSRTSGVDLEKNHPIVTCDILISNAGTWESNYKLNYLVPIQLSEVVLCGRPKTHVIFILSNSAYQSFGNDDYTCHKSGVLHYARRKQKEGYKVSTISPGTIDTGFWKDAEVDNRKYGAMKPEVVADSVLHIIKQSERGALITELIILPEKKLNVY